VYSVDEYRNIFRKHIDSYYTKIIRKRLGLDIDIHPDTISVFYETLVKEVYKPLNVEDRVVVDIGAFVSDTAIYFALRGAKHVYVYEPYPSHYELAKHYIKLLNLGNKITLFNMGIGCKEYEVMLPRDNKVVSGRDLKQYSDGVKVKITTLDNIVKSLGIENAVLKIDCEGCEYEAIICSTNETLRKFDEIMIEYHYGYKNIVEN